MTLTKKQYTRLERRIQDALNQSSRHDPEHAKDLNTIFKILDRQEKDLACVRIRVNVLERQMERIGAPLYRFKDNLIIQRIRRLPKPDYKLRAR